MKLKSTLGWPHFGLLGAALALAGHNIAAGTYSDTLLQQKPVAYWRLGETGTVPVDTAANLGSVGATANGTYNGAAHGATGALSGSSDKAAAFDGASSLISIPNSADINPQPPFTVEAWVKPGAVNTGSTLTCPVGSLFRSGNAAEGWIFYQAATGWNFRIGTTDAAYSINVTTTTAIDTNTWYHLVASYDGATAVVYVNGAQAITGSSPSFNPNSGAPMGIGARGDSAFFFKGTVDEVAVYPSILSASDVLAHYQNGTNAAPGTAYPQLVQAKSPLGYWRLDETAPVVPMAKNLGSLGSSVDGTYQLGTTLGVDGPLPPSYPGFEANNTGAGFDGISGAIAVPALNLYTNTVTITSWIKRSGDQASYAGVVFARGGDTVAGLDFHDVSNELGYHWNDDAATYSWESGLIPPDGTWAFAALVVQPDQAIMYLHDGVSLQSATNAVPHLIEEFNGALQFGHDNGARYFTGDLDEIAIFNRALSPGEIKTLALAGTAASTAPEILSGPNAPTNTIFTGDTFSLSIDADGTPPLTYQWRKDTVPLLSGTNSTYTKIGATTADSGSYDVIVTGPGGTITSDAVAITVNGASKPSVVTPPTAVTRYVSGNASFTVSAIGTQPLSYQWKLGTTVIPNATNATLSLSNLVVGDAGTYQVTISNPVGTATSSAVLTVLDPPAGSYDGTVVGFHPIAYWRLNEAAGSLSALDLIGGLSAVHTNVTTGGAGPTAPDFPGLPSTNAATTYDGTDSSTTAPIGLLNNRGAFTLTGWINSGGDQGARTGLFGQNDAVEFGYISATTIELYTPNGGTVDVDASSLVVPGTWYFIAAVADGTSLKIYINGQLAGSGGSATANYGSSAFPFEIGGDVFGSGVPFLGSLDEIAVFDHALSASNIGALFDAAKYGTGVAPVISTQPISQKVIVGDAFTLAVTAHGSVPISYQWYLGTGAITNATNASYTVSAATTGDAGSYTVKVSNPAGNATGGPASIDVVPVPTGIVLTNNLVLHLKFDGDYADSSGRANNGAAQGSPNFVPGMIGSNAVHVLANTTSGTFNYITLGTPADLLFGADTSFSIAFWTKLNGAQDDTPFISNNNGSGYGGQGFTLSPTLNGNGTLLGLTTWLADDASHSSIYITANPVLANGWHHVAWTVDRTGSATTYIDGLPIDSRTVTAIGSLDSGLAVNIGQDGTGAYAANLDVAIDDLGIWRRVLTPYEAHAIYLVGKNEGASFDTAPVLLTLSIGTTGGQIQVTFAGGALQSAPAVTGPWTTVPGATSPYAVSTSGAANTFYRVSN